MLKIAYRNRKKNVINLELINFYVFIVVAILVMC